MYKQMGFGIGGGLQWREMTAALRKEKLRIEKEKIT